MLISQISLIALVKINWFNSERYFFTDESVKINWFNSWKYPFHWCISENLTNSDLEGVSFSNNYSEIDNILKTCREKC